MNPDRLKQIEELYHAAIDLAADERARLLERACESDGDLRGEVESLLMHADRPDFLGRPPMEAIASELMVKKPRIREGSAVGPYEILYLLGSRGIGEVYRARDTKLGQEVAVRVLPETYILDRERVRRFERAAGQLISFQHPHVCALYDVGYDSGRHYLVMELVEGLTLARSLANGRIELNQAVEYSFQIAKALESVHRLGVVHGALKPGRIVLSPSGVKLMDFGLASLGNLASESSPSSDASTPDGNEIPGAEDNILATMWYMAPEQLKGREADLRTDIFTFGSIVYEMATGRRAFHGSSPAGLIASILKDDFEPMTDHQKQIPAWFELMVMRCLAKAPAGRWQTVSDLMRESGWAIETPRR